MLRQLCYPLFVTSLATLLEAAALPAVTATVEQTTQRPGESPVVSDSTFYRDNQGRIRLEGANTARIFDPRSGTAITLDLANKTAYVSMRAVATPQSGASPQVQQSVVSNGKVLKPYVDNMANLGSSIIDGNAVIGARHSVEYPPGAGGSIRFQRVTTETWRSLELRLPVLTVVSNSTNGNTVTYYRNIIVNPSLDPGLFQTPNSFRVLSRTPALPKK